MSEILTERLLLRRARSDDLAAIHAMLSHPTAMRYWSSLPHSDIEQSAEWLGRMLAQTDDVSDDFIIELEGRVVGKAGCYQVPNIGYMLHPDYWGRGIATEALTPIIAHVFGKFEIEAVIADVDPRNTASLALLGRLGFVESGRAERTWQIGEEWCDSIYLSLSRQNAAKAPQAQMR
ncbi:GNAT family N-acetyltransferase [soil metagenome]